MENWRQDRYSEVCKALKRIERRSDKLCRRIDSSSSSFVGLSQQQRQQQQHSNSNRQDARQVAVWSDELARLRDMSDRLVDFRDGLYFYSNMDYVEALNEWEHEVEKICIKAEGFSSSSSSSSSLAGAKRAQASVNNRRHGISCSYY